MNRYTQLSHSNLNDLPLLALPYEVLSKVLSGHQQQINQFEQFKDLMPKYINDPNAEDVQWANDYQKFTESVFKNVQDSFAKQDYQAAMEGLKRGQTEILKQWKPGGVAHMLESRYKEYVTNVEKIEKAVEKNKNPYYKTFFEDKLLEKVRTKDIYNPETRSSKSIGNVNIFGEVDILAEMNSYFKGKFQGKDTVFTRSKQFPNYIEKVEVKGESQDLVDAALAQFFEMPHVKQAIGVELHNVKKGIDTDKLLQQQTLFEEQIFNQHKTNNTALFNEFEQLMSGNARDKKVLQQKLKQYGIYEGKIDGNITDELKTKIQELKSKNETVEFKPSGLSADQILERQITNRYSGMYKDPSLEISKDLIFDQNAKLKIDRDIAGSLKSLVQTLTPQNTIVPGQFIMDETKIDHFSNIIQNANKSATELAANTKVTARKVLGNNNELVQVFERPDINQIASIIENNKDVLISDGKINQQKLQALLTTNGITITNDEAAKFSTAMANSNVQTLIRETALLNDDIMFNKNMASQTFDNLVKAYKEKTGVDLYQQTYSQGAEIVGQTQAATPRGDRGGVYVPQGTGKTITYKEAIDSGNVSALKSLFTKASEKLDKNEIDRFSNIGTYLAGDDSPTTKNMLSAININPSGFILVPTSNEERKKIGMNKDGSFEEGVEVKEVMPLFVTNPVTGQTQVQMIGKLNNKQTVVLKPQGVQKETMKNWLIDVAGQTISGSKGNQNEPEILGSISNFLYQEQATGTSPNANMIQQLFNLGGTRNTSIGNETISHLLHPNIQHNLKTNFIKTQEGNSYIIAYSEADQSAINAIQTNTDVEKLIAKRGDFVDAVKITSNDLNEINKSLTSLRAQTAVPMMQQYFDVNPRGTTKTSNTNVNNLHLLNSLQILNGSQQQYDNN